MFIDETRFWPKMNKKDEIKKLHSKLLYETLAVNYLHETVDKGVPLQQFQARCRIHLSTPLQRKLDNCKDILEQLEKQEVVREGNYSTLKELVNFDVKIVQEIEYVERAIALSQKPRDVGRHCKKRKATDNDKCIDGK